MPRFFVTSENISDNIITVTGEDAHHISKVLRATVGEKLDVCDMANNLYSCVISAITAEAVTLHICDVSQNNTEPPYKATLLMALPKGDKMEYIIQKAVETGVTEIIPFSSSRCVCKLDSKGGEKKRERWQKIAKNAAEQCGRGMIPQVLSPITFNQAIDIMKSHQNPFMCYEGETALCMKDYLKTQLNDNKDFCFMIGSEGGFSQEEYLKIKSQGIETVTLGKRILRCETAPVYVLSALSMFYEC